MTLRRSRVPFVLRVCGIVIAVLSMVAENVMPSLASLFVALASYPLLLTCVVIAGTLTNRESKRFLAAGVPYGLQATGSLDVMLDSRDALWAAGEALSAIDAYDVDIDWSGSAATANGPPGAKSGGRQLYVRVLPSGAHESQIVVVTRTRIILSSRSRLDRNAQVLVDRFLDACRRKVQLARPSAEPTLPD